MAATGNEVPLLSQLKLLKDWIVPQLENNLKVKSLIPASGTNSDNEDGLYIKRVIYNSSNQALSEYIDITIPLADELNNGLISNSDKAKLDALPSSFTEPAVDIVRTTTHSTSYTKDTLEIVTDSTGKVTEMWFVTAD